MIYNVNHILSDLIYLTGKKKFGSTGNSHLYVQPDAQ